MTGFWALARKEILEQRRTWRFLALVGVFTALALLIVIIPFVVALVRGSERGVGQAREVLQVFGAATAFLGTLLAIIVAMGSLASERASGTAAMTLGKPVTRSAFVMAKFLGLALSIFASLAIGSAVIYILTLILFDNGGLEGFVKFMGAIGVYLVFIGSIAFFWSGMFSRQLLAGGIALVLLVAQLPLSEIPNTERYWPLRTVGWAESHFRQVLVGPVDEIIVSGGSASNFEGRDFSEESSGNRPGPVEVPRGARSGGHITSERFEQLRREVADWEEIDGLAPRIVRHGVSARKLVSSGGEFAPEFPFITLAGVDPSDLESFGGFTLTSGGEARLEDLEEDEAYITKQAASELEAEAGDRLMTLWNQPGGPVTFTVAGVVKANFLSAFGPSLIIPLQRAQDVLDNGGQIDEILVSNRGDGISGAELSGEVTDKLRLLFADRDIASQLKELLGRERVLQALERRQGSLGGNLKEDVSALRDELQEQGLSDRLVGLLAEPLVAGTVIAALVRDGLSEEQQEAGALFPKLAELQVMNLKQRGEGDKRSEYWSAFAIALGSIVVLSVGAWAVFRRKEL